MQTKLYFRFMISALVLLFINCSLPQVEEPAHIKSFDGLRKIFENPPVEYRSAPLWVWNDDMIEEEIEKQLTVRSSREPRDNKTLESTRRRRTLLW